MGHCFDCLRQVFLNNRFPARREALKGKNHERNINEARQDLYNAYNRFNSILEPELIDIAILNIETAQKKYDYLIREIKQQSRDN